MRGKQMPRCLTDKNERLRERIMVCLTTAEYDAVRNRAFAENATMSQIMRKSAAAYCEAKNKVSQ